MLSHVPRSTIEERIDMNEQRTNADTAQQNHCHLNGSSPFLRIVCPWYMNRIRYEISYIRRAPMSTKTFLFSAAMYPGTMPPGPHMRAQRPPSTRTVQAMVVRSGVEALQPRHAHTRLWRLRVRNRAMEGRGADTHGANEGYPGNTHRQHKSVADREPVHQTSLIPPVNRI
jgi:hypothetical protein